MKRYKCRLCKHEWDAKRKNPPKGYKPKECPSCKRRDWETK